MGVTQSSRWVGRGDVRGGVEPVAGSARLRPASASELSVWNRAAFADGLTQLGLGTGDRDEALRLRDDIAGEVRMLDEHYAAIARASYRLSSPPEAIAIAERRRASIQRLSDWFAARRFEIHARTTIEVRIPLFVIAAPDVAGCYSALRPVGTPPTALSGRVTVNGTGGGSGATGHVTAGGRVDVEPGEIKAVFVPVNLTVADVTVHDDGRQVGAGIQVKVSTAPSVVEPGILRLRPDEAPPIGVFAHSYEHGCSTPGCVFTHEHVAAPAQPETKELSIGFTVFGAEASVTAGVSLTRPVVLDFELAGGHDYDLHELVQGFGIAWRTR
jgi:hypothetical protein